jgi:hypothetical protein
MNAIEEIVPSDRINLAAGNSVSLLLKPHLNFLA